MKYQSLNSSTFTIMVADLHVQKDDASKKLLLKALRSIASQTCTNIVFRHRKYSRL